MVSFEVGIDRGRRRAHASRRGVMVYILMRLVPLPQLVRTLLRHSISSDSAMMCESCKAWEYVSYFGHRFNLE